MASEIVYRVDGQDRLVSVNSAWDSFATSNEGEDAVATHVIGRNLFEFITDRTTQHLYRQMLARIRAGKNIRYTYRCDSPDCRRLMEMQVVATDDMGGVEFRSITLSEQPRDPFGSVREPKGRSAEPERVQPACGWCNRWKVEGEWLEIEQAVPRLGLLEQAVPPLLTHGICEACLQTMTAEVDRLAASGA